MISLNHLSGGMGGMHGGGNARVSARCVKTSQIGGGWCSQRMDTKKSLKISTRKKKSTKKLLY